MGNKYFTEPKCFIVMVILSCVVLAFKASDPIESESWPQLVSPSRFWRGKSKNKLQLQQIRLHFSGMKVPELLEWSPFFGKLAWTCNTSHPNRRAQSIPLSSTSSEAARPFVLTIHKRPFKWRDSVISEILASGLCRIEKRRGRERKSIHDQSTLTTCLAFLCRCYLANRRGKCACSRCNIDKRGTRLVPPPTVKKAGPFHTLPALIWMMIPHRVASPGTQFEQVWKIKCDWCRLTVEARSDLLFNAVWGSFMRWNRG